MAPASPLPRAAAAAAAAALAPALLLAAAPRAAAARGLLQVPGGFNPIPMPYSTEFLDVVQGAVDTEENGQFECGSDPADNILGTPEDQVVAGINYKFTMNTAGGVLECTAFVPLPGQGSTEYECLVDGPPLPCGTDAADMPSPGPDSE